VTDLFYYVGYELKFICNFISETDNLFSIEDDQVFGIINLAVSPKLLIFFFNAEINLLRC
jgi:hypothetical protein